MDKEYLDNYQKKEETLIWKVKKRWKETKSLDRYPPESRLRLKNPYTIQIRNEKIWYSIPFYGTTIIGLRAIPDIKLFEKNHGFEISDIENLIELSIKDRVKFVLLDPPSAFANMDFLDPIFIECDPPVLPNYPLDIEKECETEILEIASWGFSQWYLSVISSGKAPVERKLGSILMIYCKMKDFGYDELAGEILDNMILPQTYIKAFSLLNLCWILIVDPLTNPLNETVYTYRRKFLVQLVENLNISINKGFKLEFPCEVGKFLNDELKLILPKNIDGTIELNSRYELYDLRTLLSSLNHAVKSCITDDVKDLNQELIEVFSNVWDEADSLRKKSNYLKHGVSFGMGVIGGIATLPIGGIGGIIAILATELADTLAGQKLSTSISEKIIKREASSYLANIFDFKRKYKLF